MVRSVEPIVGERHSRAAAARSAATRQRRPSGPARGRRRGRGRPRWVSTGGGAQDQPAGLPVVPDAGPARRARSHRAARVAAAVAAAAAASRPAPRWRAMPRAGRRRRRAALGDGRERPEVLEPAPVDGRPTPAVAAALARARGEPLRRSAAPPPRASAPASALAGGVVAVPPPRSPTWLMPTPTTTTAAAAATSSGGRAAGDARPRSTTAARARRRRLVREVGEHPVEPGGDVGGHRLGVAGVGEQPAHLPPPGGGQVGVVGHGVVTSSRASGRCVRVTASAAVGGPRGASVDRTGGGGDRVPGAGCRPGHARRRGTPSSAASRARPREQRDFTVPTAQSRIAAASATG